MNKFNYILISVIFALMPIMSFAQNNLEVDGDAIVQNNLGIGLNTPTDWLHIKGSLAEPPGLTLQRQYSFMGGTVDNYGRIWQEESLNIGYGLDGSATNLRLFKDFINIEGRTLIAPPDACLINNDQVLRMVVERDVWNPCSSLLGEANNGTHLRSNQQLKMDECEGLCPEDVLNVYPETPLGGVFYSNLGTREKKWSELNVEFARVHSLQGTGTRNVAVNSEGRLIAGSSSTAFTTYTLQPLDFRSSFGVPFDDFETNRFIGGNLPNNFNSYLAPIHLPHGAIMTTVTYNYADDNDDEDLTMAIAYTSTNPSLSGQTEIGLFSSSESCGIACSEPISLSSHVVDNDNNIYYVIVRPQDLTWDTTNDNVAFGSAEITYSY